MPIGQVIGAHWMPAPISISSSSSIGSLALAVELVDEGHDRRVAQAADLQQLDRLRSSTPLAESITITAPSTAVSTR
jgi:hypothetical protein